MKKSSRPKQAVFGLFTALLLSAPLALSATFYYDGSGPANTLSNWWTNRDGTGANPANFTAVDQLFVVQNGQILTTASAWNVTGSNSQVTVETGGTISSATANSLRLNLDANSTFRSQSNSTGIVSSTISPSSNFIYEGVANSANTAISYGNFEVLNTTSHFFVGSITTSGNFTASAASDTIRVNLTNSVDTVINIAGDLTINSSVKLFRLTNAAGAAYGVTLNIGGGLNNAGSMVNGSATSSINFVGTGSSNVTWGTNAASRDALVTIGAGKTIRFTDSYTSNNNDLDVHGTLILSSTSTVNAGTSNITIKNGGTLGGGGIASTLVTFQAGSTHSPGNSPGEQTFAGGVQYTDATIAWELIGNTASILDKGIEYDSILVTGGSFTTSGSEIDLIFNSAGSDVDFSSAFWASDQTWAIVDSSVNRVGNFALGTISLDSLGQAYTDYGSFSLDPLSSQDVLLIWTASPVPEPSAIALFAIGFVLLAGRRRFILRTHYRL